MHKTVHVFKRGSENGMISILANGGQFSLFHQLFSLFLLLHKGKFMHMTQRKVFTRRVRCSAIASDKGGYAVRTNCVNPYPSGIKYWRTCIVYNFY